MMKLFFKIISGLFFLLALALGGSVAALLMVDPNSYKPQIITAVKEATGRDMVIEGDISVSFYPVLGFKVAGLMLGNPDGFAEKDFVKAGAIQAGVKIIPLLDKKVELTTIHLETPDITIIKNANGKTNLAFPKKEKKESKINTADFDISFTGIVIKNARVTMIDKATGKTTLINPLNLEVVGEYISTDAPVSLDFVLHNPAPAKPLKVDVKAMVKADLPAQKITARALRVKADMGLGAPIDITGDLVADMKAQNVTINNFSADWQGTSLKGQAGLDGFAPPQITFDLKADRVDLDALKPKQGAKADPNKALLPVDLLRTLNLQGAVQVKSLRTAGLDMEDLQATIKATGGQLTISPLALGLYGGRLDSSVRINATSSAPDMSVQGAVTGMKVGDFLTAKMGQDFVTGLAQLNFDLGSRGNSMTALQNAARGQIDFSFNDGYINKWQLSRLLNQAIAYFETGKLPTNVPDKIYFTSLKGVFNGQNGNFRNDNLQLIGPKTHALGAGSVNLAAQSVDYIVKAGLGDNPDDFAKAKHIPVRIQGPLAKPSYKLDMQALIEDVAGEKIEEKKQEVMDKLFQKLDEKIAPKPKAEPAPAVVPGAVEAAPPAAAPQTDIQPETEVPASALAPEASAPEVEAASPVVAPVEVSEPPLAPEAPTDAPETMPDAAPEAAPDIPPEPEPEQAEGL